MAAAGESAETTFKPLKTFVRVTRDNVSHASQGQREAAETLYATTQEFLTHFGMVRAARSGKRPAPTVTEPMSAPPQNDTAR